MVGGQGGGEYNFVCVLIIVKSLVTAAIFLASKFVSVAGMAVISSSGQ